MALWTIGATASLVIPRSWQYLEVSHSESGFCPLLALQPRQQSAMLSRLMIFSSLMMCSQLAAALTETLAAAKGLPQ